jgi:iron complex outermembrane receptor protein
MSTFKTTIGLLVGILSSGVAVAESRVLEEITVTATKKNTSLQDTPITVDVFDSHYLKRSSAREFSELVSALPNIMAPDGVAGTQNVSIRGVSSTGRGFGVEQPVGMYVNNVFAPAGSLDQYLLDIDQIEVIRGPQGAVWGRNTLAGAISYSTAKPTEEYEGYISGKIGSKDLRDVEFAISGPLSNSVRYRLAAGAIQQDGFSERPSGGTYGNKDEVSVRGTVQFLPNEIANITLIADYSKNDYHNTVPEYISGPFAAIAGTNGYSRRQDTDFYEPSETESKGLSVLADFDLNGITLSSVTGYRDLERMQNLDSDGTNQTLLNESVFSMSEQISQEIRLSNDQDASARWMVGAYYYTRDDLVDGGSEIDGVPFNLPPTSLVVEALRQDSETKSAALFATLEIDLSDFVTMIGGVRAEHEKKSTNNGTSTVLYLPGGTMIPLGGEQFDADFTEDTVSPMIGLSFNLSDKSLAYASFGRGNKSGGFNSPRSATPTFQPEEADSFEVGYKSTSADGRTILNATAFYIDYSGMQIRGLELTSTGVVRTYYNAGAMVSQGIELELVSQVTGNWDITALVGYNSADFKDFVIPGAGGAPGTVLTGNKPAFAPETSFSLRSNLSFKAGDMGDGYFQAELNHVGDHFLDFNNVATVGEQNAYLLLNARVGIVMQGGMELALWGRNLTDEDYKVDFIGDLPPAIFQGSLSHTLAPGATYGIEASYSF